jgi:osmoprotectant transport system substrate-binding protein
MRSRRWCVLAVPITLCVALLLGACSASKSNSIGGDSPKPLHKGRVVVGAFNFGESQLLAYMYAAMLGKAGWSAEVRELTNREVVEPALEQGSTSGGVDVVPEYVGSLTEFLNRTDNGDFAKPLASPDPIATAEVLRSLGQKHGLAFGQTSPATDQNVFAVTAAFAAKNKLSKMSDLKSYAGSLVLGGPAECPTRPFCQPGLERTYGLKFASFKALDAGGPLTKQAIKNGDVTIGLVLSSDGGVSALGLKILDDDKHLQTAENILPAVNSATAKGTISTLDKVAATLTTDDLIQLNKSVDVNHEDPNVVAQRWLKDEGLL